MTFPMNRHFLQARGRAAGMPEIFPALPDAGRAPFFFLKKMNRTTPGSHGHARETPETSLADTDERRLLCAACRHVITRPSERAEVQGGHRHTFANPHGLFFEIGCFRNAPGCANVGPLTTEFTWFRGYAWKVAVCGRCATHLGWKFASGSGGIFHGLVLDRLILSEPESH